MNPSVPAGPAPAAVEALEARRLMAAAPPAVTGFTLIDAAADVPIGRLADGATLDLTKLGRDLSVSAQAAGAGSVAFALDGKRVRVENAAPFAINSNTGRDYWAWAPPKGRHTLTVTPYAGDNATGAAGAALTVRFTVTLSSTVPAPTPTPSPTPSPTPTPAPGPVLNVQSSATTPVARRPERHAEFLRRIKQGPVGLLFLGDSITDHWRLSANRKSYDAAFGRYSPANFGVAGDQTQHVLWRVTHGELDGIRPKAVVLMIGTNNLPYNTDAQIASGVAKIVQTIRGRLPDTKVLLLGVFPREAQPDAWGRKRAEGVNRELAKLGGGAVRYLDVRQAFLRPDGTIGRDVMYDGLHLTAEGYRRWADAIRSVVDGMM